MTTATKYKTYPKYKPSGIDWLGDISEGWEVKRIKNTTYVKGRIGWQNLRSDEFKDEGVLCITGTDFKNGLIDIKNAYRVDQDRYEQDPYIQLKEKDLLITKDGTIGKIALVIGLNEPATLNSGVFVTRPVKKQYLQEFMFWVLNSNIFTEFIGYMANGSTIEHLYQNIFVNFSYPLPQINEQKEIVAFLDRETAKIDKMVAKKQKLMELFKEKRQALITHAVTCGLDENGRLRQKPKCLPASGWKPSGIDGSASLTTSWLGDIPEGWEAKRLRYYFDYHSGGVWGDEEKGDQNDLICLRVADFDFDHFGLSENDLTTRNIPENQHSRILEKGDILLEKSGGGEKQTVGRAVRFDSGDRAVCSNFIEKLTPLKSHNSKYISYLMGALYFGTINVRSIKQTTGIQNLDIYAYFSEVVPFPEKEIQQSIAAFLDRETAKIDEMMKKVKTQIEKLQEYRQALITSAVTGKINVVDIRLANIN